MAKRYQVHSFHNLTTPSSPDEEVVNALVDIPLLLSQRLQRNIRQGQVIHIHSVKASLKPTLGGSQDIGVAFTGEVWHAPATRNTCKAWREAFSVWRKQKQLRANATGSLVRYDDFEVGWNASLTNSRTSTLYATGLSDSDAESVVIYGTSTTGDDITLEDILESAQTQEEPSRFPLSNAIVKQSKYVDEFPNPVKSPVVAHLSANSAQTSYDSGASVSAPTTYIQDSASLCGVVKVVGYMLPENTVGHTQDDMTLTLTFTVSMGTPLVKTSLGKKPKRTSGAKGGRRATGGRRKGR
jgi:hypothetical protein